MYNYSPSKFMQGDHNLKKASITQPGSFDNLPAVPERHSSSSLFENIADATGSSSHNVYNLYDRIDNLRLSASDEGGAQHDHEMSQQGSGGRDRDEFQDQMDEIEQTMKGLALPRFKLPDRPLKLSENCDVFADIDRSNTHRMELFLPKVGRGDVLCIDVCCVPSDMRAFNLTDVCEGSFNRPVDHEPLEVLLSPASAQETDTPGVPQARPHAPFAPVYHNGEYEFNLTSAHGISSGRYVLTVLNKGSYTQSVRCKMKLRSYVQAATIEAHEVLTVHDVPQEEFCYFRFVLKDRSSFMSIRLVPCPNSTGTASDPDLYVSNKYAGLVSVDRDNYIWRSTNIGLDQVDIHPDDLNAQRSGIFIIGVLGYRDVNSFSLEVRLGPPVRCIDLKPGGVHDLLVRTDRYTFYRIPIDSSVKSKQVISVSPVDENGHGDRPHGKQNSSDHASSDLSGMDQQGKAELENQFGRGVYTADSLVSSGVFASNEQGLGIAHRSQSPHTSASVKCIEEAIGAQLALSPNRGSHRGGRQGSVFSNTGGSDGRPVTQQDSQHLSVLIESLPNSIAKEAGVYPVLHLSSSCIYPTAESHTWRATSILGPAKAMIETDEWLHTATRYCYLSVIGVALPQVSRSPTMSRQNQSSRNQLDDTQQSVPTTPPRRSDSESVGKLTSPILPTLGVAPVGSASGRFARTQNTVLELKVRTERDHLAEASTDFDSSLANTPSSIPCTISLESIVDSSDLSPLMQARYKLFSSIFESIDGSSISQKDRFASGEVDTPSLTYGEIEFPSFVRLLEDMGGREGQVFVDVGSGTGKAVVAAALSGAKFLRCIGVEVLPGLCQASRSAIDKCKAKVQSFTSSQQRRFSRRVSSATGSPLAISGGEDVSASSDAPTLPMIEIWLVLRYSTWPLDSSGVMCCLPGQNLCYISKEALC
mmetsp:Transcript_33205/g.61905  ORF Transcript_33205/g.61905 Transcript_33205/m.61905 type:complete len:928 (-) Transcript_33205:600-3383(-)